MDDILSRNMPSATTWGRVAVFYGIGAASADHEYDADEIEAIRRLATRIGFAEKVVAEIEALYGDAVALS